jgi:hypothetical protein
MRTLIVSLIGGMDVPDLITTVRNAQYSWEQTPT